MKIRAIRILCAVITLLMLSACVPINVFADSKTPINAVVADSDLSEVAVLYGRTDDLEFEISDGAPAVFSQSWVTCWEVYNEETDKWENYKGRFYPGKYRVFAQIRIDGDDAHNYKLGDSLTCTVDGEAWTVDSISNHYDFSAAFATSPVIEIADDPSVIEPIDVENAYFNLSGYVEGGKFSETVLYPHLGSEGKVEIIGEPVFVDMTDENEDGIPDNVDTENGIFTPADDVITPGTEYMLLFNFIAKEGYDLYSLEAKNIHLPVRRNGLLHDIACSYNDETKIYRAIFLLKPCVNNIEFTVNPENTVGYHNGDFGGVEISWETNGAVTKYQIYKWDEEDEWDVMPYTDVFGTGFVFQYQDGFTAGRYRIEAINEGETVAISEEFTITWEEEKALSMPIRIDFSGAVGSREPIELKEYYPESEQYYFSDEFLYPVNQWVDAETGLPAEHFEHGKTYTYTIYAIANDGYYFDVEHYIMGEGEHMVSDVIRAYGIGWDKVINDIAEFDKEYFATFAFKYDEQVGIPSESDKLFYELVFDASALVGMDAPEPIPSELFSHAGLTLCEDDCDCDSIPDSFKNNFNTWISMTTQSPAESFEANNAYTYIVGFHINDGWDIPSTLSLFDFILSDVGIETVEAVYNAEMRMLAVRFGFVCGESGKIEAGEHTCTRDFTDAAEPSCTEDGNIAHYACKCGKTYSDKWGMYEISDLTGSGELVSTGHTFGDGWISDDESHWKECTCGEKESEGTHTDTDNSGKCDECDQPMSVSVPAPPPADEPKENDSGSDMTAQIIIISLSAVALIIIGFDVYWFVIKKKTLADLMAKLKK